MTVGSNLEEPEVELASPGVSWAESAGWVPFLFRSPSCHALFFRSLSRVIFLCI
jgi:hypothetical protein